MRVFSDTNLSTTFDVRAVKYTVHRVMSHKETLPDKQMDRVRYFSNKMSGVSVTGNLTVRVNPTERERQQAELQRYFLGCVS